MKKLICLIIITILIITGCTAEKDATNSIFKVVPSKLFEGDTKKLEPHLDMITGCIEVEYKGNKESFGLKYEIWEEGKFIESNNVISTKIKDDKFDGEVNISLKDILDTNLEKSDLMIMKTVISDNSGYVASTKHIDRFDKEFGYGPIELQKEVNATENEEVTVWGLTANKDSYSTGGKDIEDEVKNASWGLILKIYLK
jgi:hypothetical protein